MKENTNNKESIEEKRKNRLLVPILAVFIVSVIMLVLCLNDVISIGMVGYIALLTITSGVLLLCSLFVSVARKVKLNASGYIVVATVDCIVGMFILIYSLYDIFNASGIVGGLAGSLLLVYVMPIILLILIVDFILYLFRKR